MNGVMMNRIPVVDEPYAPQPALAKRVLIGPSLVSLIDLYWQALADLQNCLEDVVGADGRIEYLRALRWRFVATVQALEGALEGEAAYVGRPHRAAYALEHGAPRLGLTGDALRTRLRFDDPSASPRELEEGLLALGAEVLGTLPGEIPAAQGSTGQREVIRAMQLWSKAAEANAEDIGFLAARLAEL